MLQTQLRPEVRPAAAAGESLRSASVELGWEPVPAPRRSPLLRLLHGRALPVDCDLAAVVCDRDGRMLQGVNCQVPVFGPNAVVHRGDDPTGACGGERLLLDFSRLPSQVGSVALVLHVYCPDGCQQHLGMVRGSVRLSDGNDGRQFYQLALTGRFDRMQGLVIGEFQRRGSGWIFRAVETPVEDAGRIQSLYQLYV